MVFDKRYWINGIWLKVFDKVYLIKSISAVTYYNSSSCFSINKTAWIAYIALMIAFQVIYGFFVDLLSIIWLQQSIHTFESLVLLLFLEAQLLCNCVASFEVRVSFISYSIKSCHIDTIDSCYQVQWWMDTGGHLAEGWGLHSLLSWLRPIAVSGPEMSTNHIENHTWKWVFWTDRLTRN